MRVNTTGHTGERRGGGDVRFDDRAYIEPKKRVPGIIAKAYDTERGGAEPLRTKNGELMINVLVGFPDLEGQPGIWYKAALEGQWGWRGVQVLHACGYQEDADGFIDYEARDLPGAPVVVDIEDWERTAQNPDGTPVLDADGNPVIECVSQIARLHVTRGGGAPTIEAAKADAETPTEGDMW